MKIKEIVIGSIFDFLIWCLPLAIFTKILVDYAIVGCLMGLLCILVIGPRFDIGNNIYNRIYNP